MPETTNPNPRAGLASSTRGGSPERVTRAKGTVIRRGVPLRAAVMLVATALIAGWLTLPAPATAGNGVDAARAADVRLRELTKVSTGWTGNTQTCDPGTESVASTQATLEALNLLRTAAGVGPVTFDPNLNSLALSGALMMAAANGLSHAPGPDWPCYTDAGAQAAARSSLALGMTGATAMLGYVIDSGVESLGHRRWALNPAAVTLGSASTNTTNALWNLVEAPVREVAADAVVAWPPAGWLTADLVPPVWSVAVGDGKASYTWDNGAAIAAERVIGTPTVKITVDQRSAVTQSVTELAPGFGTGRTFSWTPNLGLDLNRGDHKIGITISGLEIRVSDQPPRYRKLSVNYEVGTTPSPLVNVGPTPNPVLTVAATAVSKASRLRVDIDPDQPGARFKFYLQRQNSKGNWSKSGTYKTKGSSLTLTVNRKRGTYRVVVPAQRGYGQVVSGPVTLKR